MTNLKAALYASALTLFLMLAQQWPKTKPIEAPTRAVEAEKVRPSAVCTLRNVCAPGEK